MKVKKKKKVNVIAGEKSKEAYVMSRSSQYICDLWFLIQDKVGSVIVILQIGEVRYSKITKLT